MEEKVCPVCHTEQTGLFCKNCGWDFTVDYLRCQNLSRQEQEWYEMRLEIMRENYNRLMDVERKKTILERRLIEITLQRDTAIAQKDEAITQRDAVIAEKKAMVQQKHVTLPPHREEKEEIFESLTEKDLKEDLPDEQLYKKMKKYKDLFEAFSKWEKEQEELEKSVENKTPLEICQIGCNWLLGLSGYKVDMDKAFFYLSRAAQQNEPTALHNLGWMYANGKGTEQNYNEALKCYRKAAERNHPSGQAALGWMYMKGFGLEQDDAEAVKWYRKSAEQNHALAQFYMGFMYENGRGVTMNKKEAVKWYEKAATQGQKDAQFKMGKMYENGVEGLKQDLTQAKKWYQKAADNGDEEAKKKLENWK